MDQDRNTRIAEALDRLFRTYQQSDRNADPGELARERIGKAKVYLEAVAIYEARDVEAGVDSLLNGSFPGHNPSFVPPAPVVGSATRRAMEFWLDSERRANLGHPRLPPPDIEKSPESRARVRAAVDDLRPGSRSVTRLPRPAAKCSGAPLLGMMSSSLRR